MTLFGGYACMYALGVWTGPYVMDEGRMATVAPVVSQAEQPDAAATERRSTTATRRPSRAATARAATPAIAPSAPVLHEQLQPLLNKGADMSIAAEGFRTAEQFAAVAHAARNTGVPFMLLKHRVLNEGKTLGQAIRESKPEVSAEIEADRAVAEARSDLASLAG